MPVRTIVFGIHNFNEKMVVIQVKISKIKLYQHRVSALA